MLGHAEDPLETGKCAVPTRSKCLMALRLRLIAIIDGRHDESMAQRNAIRARWG